MSIKTKVVSAGVVVAMLAAVLALIASVRTRALISADAALSEAQLARLRHAHAVGMGVAAVQAAVGDLQAAPLREIEGARRHVDAQLAALEALAKELPAGPPPAELAAQSGAATVALAEYVRAARAAAQATSVADRTLRMPVLQAGAKAAVDATEALFRAVTDAHRSTLAGEHEGRRTRNFVEIALLIGAVVFIVILGSVMFAKRLLFGLSGEVALLRDNATHLREAAEQVAAASETLAAGASKQASALQESSAALEEMASTTRRNTESASTARGIAFEVRTAAEEGIKQMSHLLSAMDGIKGSSDEISKIIRVIDEIAFQTNILALNAAVEAARAGDAGMGFAVVADEVRNLAQRSAQAARETAARIEESINRGTAAGEISKRAKAALDEILVRARKSDEVMSHIAASAQDQSQGIEQANSSSSLVDSITQQNATLAEEVATAAEELKIQSGALETVVHRLEFYLRNRAPSGADVPPPGLARSAAHLRADADLGSPVIPASRNGHAKPQSAVPLPGESTFEDFRG